MIGVVIGGVASGVGKTTLTLGLIGALRRRGLTVQPFKVGPDYIDPSQHAQVAGRPSRNLDSWQVPEEGLRELFARAAASADAALVEGVMGLFDGRTGGGEVGSTAQVAKLLGLPVLLVVDAAKAARSVAATVLGCLALDPAVKVIGVVLNNVAGERHAEIGREAIESLTSVPVLGWLPRNADLRQEERYLGLVPAAERQLSAALIARTTALVEEHVDVDRLVSLAQVGPPQAGESGLFPAETMLPQTRIAVAQDEAFSFYYQDSLDLLSAWGAELVPFSPLRDGALPPNVGGVYLGGGFPELFAIELSVNAPMLASVRAAAQADLPIYAECGGLMYLQEALIDADGRRHRMAGIVPGQSTLVGKRLTLGYREVRARRDTPVALAGQTLRGHEFHWSVCDRLPPDRAAYDVLGGAPRAEGFAGNSVLASYVHLHFASDTALAPRFVRTCSPASASPDTGTSDVGRSQHLPTQDASGQAHFDSHLPRTAPSASPTCRIVGGGDLPERGSLQEPGSFLRQHGLPPADIEALSHRRIEAVMSDRLPEFEPERGLVARLVYTTGDPDIAARVALVGDPIAAAVNALADGGPLIVDVGMVSAGISRTLLAALGVEMHVAIRAEGIDLVAARHYITRSAAGIFALSGALDGAVVAIGNAPTALLALLDLVNSQGIRPAVIVGMPVGFVAAEESKELLLGAGLPCVTVRGTRGGSPLAAATVNYLLNLAARRRSPTFLPGYRGAEITSS
jgi:cobyrinic acid a,c-diamide synthase